MQKEKDNSPALAADSIRSRIYTIRDRQVMLDSDLAELYNVRLKRLNEQVKRNISRFPQEFMFQLTNSEFNSLRSQFVILNKEGTQECLNDLKSQIATSSWGGKRKLPYAFTEQGVAMLSGVLKSDIAVRMSIQIINAFVAMRRFISSNALVFQRLDNVERKQVEHDKKFEEVFDAIQSKGIEPEKGIFFDGRVVDAYKLVSDVIRSAEKSIVLIDNYVDDSVLVLLTKRKKNVQAKIFTKQISKQLLLDVEKHNSQYPFVELTEFKLCHDRFLIIDDKEVYHFGASLKDLGKKWFAFCKFGREDLGMLERIR
ncbi:MAG: ORF6N domain-containing protein [Candidatus Nanoarchaeia archaeon]|nr:ORF6N domain-containing protein [Candidatus Nanoarchaeia archaeon]